LLDTGKLRSRIDGREAADARWWLVIVDVDRRVRLIRAFPKENVKQLAAVAKQWNAGRQSFSTHCGHCHGDDGADTSYPNSKTLAGISQRLTPEQIIEGGENFGAVSVSTWSKADIDSLLLYISGL
jgi:mono/diheme cytochrome c family protein